MDSTTREFAGGRGSPYTFRSTATTGVAIGLDLQSPYISFDQLKKAIDELNGLRPFWLGDYYPLTEVNTDDRACGWQFHWPDFGGGFAVFFRRSKSPDSKFEIDLRGLDQKANYKVTFAETYDIKGKRLMSGAGLARLRVEIGSAPGSVLIRYRKAGRPAHAD